MSSRKKITKWDEIPEDMKSKVLDKCKQGIITPMPRYYNDRHSFGNRPANSNFRQGFGVRNQDMHRHVNRSSSFRYPPPPERHDYSQARKVKKSKTGPRAGGRMDRKTRNATRTERNQPHWKIPLSTKTVAIIDSNGERLIEALQDSSLFSLKVPGTILGIQNHLGFLQKNLPAGVEKIIISHGTQDALNGDGDCVPARVDEVVAKIRRVACYSGKIIIVGLPPLDNVQGAQLNTCEAANEALLGRTSSIVSAVSTTDILKKANPSSYPGSFMEVDRIHLNLRGCQEIAKTMHGKSVDPTE